MVYIITGAFIIFDIVTGLIKAFKEKAYNSSIMREGLFHKSACVLVVVFASLIDYAQSFIDVGFTIPLTIPVCVYIVLMECGSIYENICKINPELATEKLKQYFAKLKK